MSYLGQQNYKMVNGRTQLPHNYIYAGNPTIDVNPPLQYMTWMNSSTGVVFTCVDNTPNANIWRGTRMFQGATPLALSFDGETGYSNTRYLPKGGQPYTWIVRLRYTGGDGGAFGCHDGSNHRFYIGLQNISLNPTIYTGVGSAYDTSTNVSYSLFDWVYLILTYDGISSVKFYINNNLVSNYSASFSGTSSKELLMGARYFTSVDLFSKADVSQFILLNFSMTDTEVDEFVANQRYSSDGSDQIFYFDMAYATIIDLSPSGYVLQNYGSVEVIDI